MGLAWDATPEEAWGELADSEADAIEDEIVAYLEGIAQEVEEWMKTGAPWTDRTGDARRSLFTAVEHEVRAVAALLLSHGSLIEYGVYLEHANRGRYSILRPALDYWSYRVFEDVRAIVRRHGG